MIEAKICTGMTMCRWEQQGNMLHRRYRPCLQSASEPEGLRLTLCLLPCAQSIFTNAADCKLWLFSPAAEGPGVVLFLGVFWSPLQAVNWHQQKDWKAMKCWSSLTDVIFLRITFPSRILACEILASRCVERCSCDVWEEEKSIQPFIQHRPSAHFTRDPHCFDGWPQEKGDHHSHFSYFPPKLFLPKDLFLTSDAWTCMDRVPRGRMQEKKYWSCEQGT